MSANISGKTALVTGASGGIGRAIAQHLAAAGAEIVVHYGSGHDRAEETVRLVTTAGGKARSVQADLSKTSDIEKLAGECAGGLDILVNNAGIARGYTIDHTSEEDFDSVFSTNVKGIFFLTKAILPRLNSGASIVNISSMVSIAAYPAYLAYGMSKSAVNSFTRSLAAELGPRGIRVNAIAPGATDTEFVSSVRDNPEIMAGINAATALGRMGTPDEIARAVTWVASPEGGWITGQVIQVSGGMHL
ncbi:SDR family NAD(P)-dependent oxidoreductase [Methylorubrum aminovorans]